MKALPIQDGATYGGCGQLRRQERVAWLTIERPERRNALSADVRAGLFAGTRRFNSDDSARVLVLTGSG